MKRNTSLNVLVVELDRLKRYNAILNNQLSNLPKGSLQFQKGSRTNKKYAKHVFYNKGKVVCKYIGPEKSNKVKKLEDQIKKYKQLKEELKDNNFRIKDIERILKYDSRRSGI